MRAKVDPDTAEQEAVEHYISLYGRMPCFAEAKEGEEPEFLCYVDSWDAYVEAFGTVSAPKNPRHRRDVDNSPEARAARAEAKRREAEALAYVAAYRGTWGLPLDIRADKRWGTKYMKLSDRQVEALLAGKARDEQRAAEQEAARVDPRQQAAREWLLAHKDDAIHSASRGYTFLLDMLDRARVGTLTENQLAAVERSMEREAQLTRMEASVPSSAPRVTEGMYQSPEGDIFKVQHTRADHTRLYAKRLVVREGSKTGSFEYEQGGIRRIQPEWRMTLEQAEAFGKLYGMCCVCGAELTDETSIARGIGPVCAEKVAR